MDSPQTIVQPRRIAFLLIDGFALMSYSSAVEPLRAANLLSLHPLYDIHHLAVRGTHATSSSGAQIPTVSMSESIGELDDIFVVAGGDPGSFDCSRVFRWLQQSSRRRVRLGGISGGPVILARAGVMLNRRMTAHWEHVDALKEISPDLLIERGLYVIDRDRLTCAGGIAPLDMMHALITEQHGAMFARRVSDWFMHTDVRPSGGPQRAGLCERYGITNMPLAVTIETMENRIADPLDLDQLAKVANISKRQLQRLFDKQMGVSLMRFYRDLRLEKARNLLTQSSLSLTEIALATGFSSSSHFSTSFQEKYGETPSRLRS